MTTSATLRVIGLSRGLLAGLLGSTLALSVQAGEIELVGDHPLVGDEKSMTVSYAGLDLSDPAAMHTLYGRLKVAARIVCGGDISGVREVQRIFAHKACVSDALEAAVRSIDNADLTALHRSAESEAPLT
jgi:UrcA family protein